MSPETTLHEMIICRIEPRLESFKSMFIKVVILIYWDKYAFDFMHYMRKYRQYDISNEDFLKRVDLCEPPHTDSPIKS